MPDFRKNTRFYKKVYFFVKTYISQTFLILHLFLSVFKGKHTGFFKKYSLSGIII